MNAIKSIKVLTIGCLLVGLTGCATYPISKNLRKQAQLTKNAGFSAIARDPSAYQGRVVIWGGSVIKTVNETNGTSIYVLESPLNRWERPKPASYSEGRFIARSSGFVDPEVYRRGTKITVAGELAGTETHSLNNVRYVYPVVTVKEINLWRLEREPYWVGPYCDYGWWDGSYWPYYYYDGFYPFYYPPYYHRYRYYPGHGRHFRPQAGHQGREERPHGARR